eukprot:scaffold2314_cov267-Pinguiococcus_pyrenoidosus.AAC.1
MQVPHLRQRGTQLGDVIPRPEEVSLQIELFVVPAFLFDVADVPIVAWVEAAYSVSPHGAFANDVELLPSSDVELPDKLDGLLSTLPVGVREHPLEHVVGGQKRRIHLDVALLEGLQDRDSRLHLAGLNKGGGTGWCGEVADRLARRGRHSPIVFSPTGRQFMVMFPHSCSTFVFNLILTSHHPTPRPPIALPWPWTSPRARRSGPWHGSRRRLVPIERTRQQRQLTEARYAPKTNPLAHKELRHAAPFSFSRATAFEKAWDAESLPEAFRFRNAWRLLSKQGDRAWGENSLSGLVRL